MNPNANAAAKLPVSGMPMFASAIITWSAAPGAVPMVAFCNPTKAEVEADPILSQFIVITPWLARYVSAAKNSPTITITIFRIFFIA